jgi:hypothetical protein
MEEPMPEDSKPVLSPEAAAELAAAAVGPQTAPLRVPPGCSVAVELMDTGGGSTATAPAGMPPEAAASQLLSAAGGSVPSQQPPEA